MEEPNNLTSEDQADLLNAAKTLVAGLVKTNSRKMVVSLDSYTVQDHDYGDYEVTAKLIRPAKFDPKFN
jgi:hypothetical protein